jgi:hypothetical protein
VSWELSSFGDVTLSQDLERSFAEDLNRGAQHWGSTPPPPPPITTIMVFTPPAVWVQIATSNRAPDKLYEGGLQRDLFLPCIARLKKRCESFDIMSTVDYRRLARQLLHTNFFVGRSRRGLTPSQKLGETFGLLAGSSVPIAPTTVEVNTHPGVASPRTEREEAQSHRAAHWPVSPDGARLTLRERESEDLGLTREVETPLPSNSPHDHMILRVDLVGSPECDATRWSCQPVLTL